MSNRLEHARNLLLSLEPRAIPASALAPRIVFATVNGHAQAVVIKVPPSRDRAPK